MENIPKNKINIPMRSLMSDEIYGTIKKWILDGTLKPGERLREMEIARQFNTSQTPVREAFKQLQKDKLLKGAAFKGVFIEEIEDIEIPEIYQLRGVLEIISLKWFILKMNEADIVKLKNILDDMKNASLNNNIPLLVEKDISFHGYICTVADSKNLYPMWSLINGKASLVMAKIDIIYKIYKDINKIVGLHEEILDALEKKNKKLVMKKYKKHAEFVLKDLIKIGIINPKLEYIFDDLEL